MDLHTLKVKKINTSQGVCELTLDDIPIKGCQSLKLEMYAGNTIPVVTLSLYVKADIEVVARIEKEEIRS